MLATQLAPQQPFEGAIANLNRFLAQIYAIQLEQVERTERHGGVVGVVEAEFCVTDFGREEVMPGLG